MAETPTNRAPRNQGAAVAPLVAAAVLILSVTVAVVGAGVETGRVSRADIGALRARAAARNAAHLAMAELWTEFHAERQGPVELASLRGFLDAADVTEAVASPSDGIPTTLDHVEITRLELSRTDHEGATTVHVDVDAVLRVNIVGTVTLRRASVRESFTIVAGQRASASADAPETSSEPAKGRPQPPPLAVQRIRGASWRRK